MLKRVALWGAAAVSLVLLAFLIAYWRSDNTCGQAPRGTLMKAVIYCDYGTADVLKYDDIEKPTPAEHQVLVKVRAASVNPLDWHYMRGTPYLVRLSNGLRKPETMRMGVDYAGVVEAVGKGVVRFKPGDEVYGGRDGAFAEYVTVLDDRSVVLKPANMSFAQAAAVPIAAITALQALRDSAKIQPGQKVLINGASGGVGTFAVQIAKSYGAEVTGVSSTRNLEMVRSLGADHVVDYTKEDFTKGEQRYDVVIDCVGNRQLLDVKRVMQPKGIYVLIGGGGPDEGNWVGALAGFIKVTLLSPFVSQDFGSLMAQLNPTDLGVLNDLMQSGKVTPAIDRHYKLSEAAQAIKYLEAGHARGKVILDVE